MDSNQMRERASALHFGEINSAEYLQEVVDFLICNKNHLPKSFSHCLREAFGKRPLSSSAPLRNRQDALDRVRGVEREDIKTPEYLSDVIPFYEENGHLFWTGRLSSPTNQGFCNVLSDIYYANKRGTTANSVRRAFYCVALYRVIRRVMELHGSKTFTTNIANFCADMILKDSDTENLEGKDDIVQQLRSDYKIGCVYEPYAQKAGSGIFFYLFILPSTLYEKYLNKSDDVDAVLSHYRGTGFEPQSNTTSAAASILDFIARRFDSQISIFRLDLVVSRPIRSTRKRNLCNGLQYDSTSKRARHTDSSRPKNCSNPSEQIMVAASEGDVHVRQDNNHDHANRPDRNNVFHVINPELSHFSTSHLGDSISIEDPSSGLSGSNLHARSLENVNSANTQVTGGSDPHMFTSLSIQPGTGLNINSDPSRGLSMATNSPARLMNEFQLESIIEETNAAQLMQDFHLENFHSADRINAAQLMRQFDWGYYSLQNM